MTNPANCPNIGDIVGRVDAARLNHALAWVDRQNGAAVFCVLIRECSWTATKIKYIRLGADVGSFHQIVIQTGAVGQAAGIIKSSGLIISD